MKNERWGHGKKMENELHTSLKFTQVCYVKHVSKHGATDVSDREGKGKEDK